MENRNRWDWGGAIVLVLAIGFAIGWVGSVFFILSNPWAFSPEQLSAIATVGNGFLILIAGYLGLRIGHQRRRNDDDE